MSREEIVSQAHDTDSRFGSFTLPVAEVFALAELPHVAPDLVDDLVDALPTLASAGLIHRDDGALHCHADVLKLAETIHEADLTIGVWATDGTSNAAAIYSVAQDMVVRSSPSTYDDSAVRLRFMSRDLANAYLHADLGLTQTDPLRATVRVTDHRVPERQVVEVNYRRDENGEMFGIVRREDGTSEHPITPDDLAQAVRRLTRGSVTPSS